jgi:hypothetical protein
MPDQADLQLIDSNGKMVVRPSDREDDGILTALSAREWTVNVEQAATCQVTLTNGGDREATFVVSVEGLNPDWVTISPAQVHLNRNERADVTVTFTPPRSPDSRAGAHHLALVVTSPQYPGRYSQRGATLIIQPYHEFSLGELTPRRQTLSWFVPSGQVTIPITNHSNRIASFRLEGADEAGDCSFEFQVPGERVSLARQVELRLQPGQKVLVPVRITPRSRRLVSLGQHTHLCVIATTLLGERPTRRALLARLRSAPLIGPGLAALISLGLVVLAGFMLQQAISRTAARNRMAQGNQMRPMSSFDSGAHQPEKPTSAISPQNATSEANPGEMTYEDMFKEIARSYDLDWRLLAELAYRESHLDPLALGDANEVGLMQILPSTWNEWAPQVEVTDPWDAYSNLLVAAAYLAFLKEYCGEMGYPGDEWMLIAYNWGPENLRQFIEDGGGWGQVPLEARQYALDILQGSDGEAMNHLTE